MVCTGHRVIRGGTTRIVSRLVLSGTEERGVVPKYGVIYNENLSSQAYKNSLYLYTAINNYGFLN